MAGAGYKLFNTGDVLTAAQVNTYLQEQAVMRFATTAARTTALAGVLAEGMVTYIDATDSLEFYNGSAWVAVNTTAGDITGITTGATSGLTGGVTSGTADLKFNTTAKGGLLVGTGSGTVSELAVGTNNQVLTADSTTATGLKWAAAGSGFVGCAAYNDAFNFTFTSGTAAVVSFPNESFDTDGFHSTSSNTSRITVPSGKAGKYLIIASFDINGVSNYYICTLRRFSSSGSQYTVNGLNRQFTQNAGGNNFAGGTQAIIDDAAVGDYWELYWQLGQTSGTLSNNYARFQAYYLGA